MPKTGLTISDLKGEVRDFWNANPCGKRYMSGEGDLEGHAHARFALEPYIPEFAQFSSAEDLRVLEIGVGMGADYVEWLKAGAHATGVDLSSESLAQTRRRCESAGYKSDLHVADAESLPFANDTFDVVYSYGVMHHSPDTPLCVREALRVLKPGGEARIMLYHHPSLTGLMLWFRYGALQGKSLRQCAYDHLESPGTKTYTQHEARQLMEGFEGIRMRQVFSPGDLLLVRPSPRFQGLFYRLVWRVYPRSLVKMLFRNWGLFLLITARKPCETA